MDRTDLQPPVSRWGSVWRYALVLVISGFAWSTLLPWQWENARWWFWLDLGLGLAGLVAVRWRRRFPVAIATLTNAAAVVSGSLGGPATLALFSLSTGRRWRQVIPVAVVALVSGLVMMAITPIAYGEGELGINLIAMVSIVGVTVGWGMYIGSRRELLASWQARAETAESEQAAREASARTAERARIAREMHDVLAHRISLVAMHAGALSYRTDLPPEQVKETAGIIQSSAHQALTELREVLGILRDGPGDAAPELPQPSAVDLPDLLLEARRSGMHVEPGRTLPLDEIPVSLGRTVYRVVQEGLTNARKHAPDTLVTVDLVGDPAAGLTVEVRNPLRVGSVAKAPESGLGLIGLAERTALAGGRMTHRVSTQREFILSAWLPWPA